MEVFTCPKCARPYLKKENANKCCSNVKKSPLVISLIDWKEYISIAKQNEQQLSEDSLLEIQKYWL
jgi:hypothetical protein